MQYNEIPRKKINRNYFIEIEYITLNLHRQFICFAILLRETLK